MLLKLVKNQLNLRLKQIPLLARVEKFSPCLTSA